MNGRWGKPICCQKIQLVLELTPNGPNCSLLLGLAQGEISS